MNQTWVFQAASLGSNPILYAKTHAKILETNQNITCSEPRLTTKQFLYGGFVSTKPPAIQEGRDSARRANPSSI